MIDSLYNPPGPVPGGDEHGVERGQARLAARADPERLRARGGKLDWARIAVYAQRRPPPPGMVPLLLLIRFHHRLVVVTATPEGEGYLSEAQIMEEITG